jgi:hypothetical protein
VSSGVFQPQVVAKLGSEAGGWDACPFGDQGRSEAMADGLSIMPVPPVRTKSGALAALLGVLDEQEAIPTPFPGYAKDLGSFKVQQASMSISLAVTLGYGAFFKGSGSAKQQGFYLDAMAFSDQYEERGSPAPIVAVRWGCGIRALIRAFDINTEVSMSLGMVGAAIKMGYAKGEYSVEGYGVGGTDGLKIVLGELASVGEFDFESYLKITGPVAHKLADHLKTNEATLKPEPVGVALARAVDPLSTARAVYHAVWYLADRRPLGDALRAAEPGLDRQTIRIAYDEMAGIGDDTTQPSKDAQGAAEEWLHTRP